MGQGQAVLVSEGREGIRHHLHELQCRTFVVVPLLERFYESLEGPAEFSAKDRPDLAHDGDALR